MASYPTSVKTFTTKTNGQTIDPAHVNDLQDEVAAIEAGLLQGTAPLNSSNSTLAALSVTGNCTISGLLSASSGVLTGSHIKVSIAQSLDIGDSSNAFRTGYFMGLAVGGISTGTLAQGDNHNWAPNNFANAFMVRITTNSSGSTLTGLTAGPRTGALRMLFNAGPATLGLQHDAGSSVGNRFILRGSSNATLGGNGSMLFYYSTLSAGWYQVGI